jgi:hypothetical protein
VYDPHNEGTKRFLCVQKLIDNRFTPYFYRKCHDAVSICRRQREEDSKHFGQVPKSRICPSCGLCANAGILDLRQTLPFSLQIVEMQQVKHTVMLQPGDAKKKPTLKRHTNAIVKLYEDCSSEEEYAEHADFLIAFLTTLKRRKQA